MSDLCQKAFTNSHQLLNIGLPRLFKQCFNELQNCLAQASPTQIYEKVKKVRFTASGRKYIVFCIFPGSFAKIKVIYHFNQYEVINERFVQVLISRARI